MSVKQGFHNDTISNEADSEFRIQKEKIKMIEEYMKAKKAGEKEYKAMLAEGKYPYLPALDEILPESGTMTQHQLGLIEIPVDLIGGTKTRARQNSFAPDFMPLLGTDTEFAMKWSNLYQAQMDEGFNSPIKVYEYLHTFYVQEGNKRVSVSRFLEMPTIMADVTRIMPSPDVMRENPSYAEFLDFYRVAPIYDIVCNEPGAYREMAALLGREIGPAAEPWPEELVKDLRSGYWRFTKVIHSLQGKGPEMALGDAFLVYLRIFIGDAFDGHTDKDVERRLKRIRKEFFIASNKDKVSLVESADDAVNAGSLITKAEKAVAGSGTLVGKVLSGVITSADTADTGLPKPPAKPVIPGAYSAKKPLRAAFIYNKEPSDSNWLYNHEVGRFRLEEVYGGMVKTAAFIVRECKPAAEGQQQIEAGDVSKAETSQPSAEKQHCETPYAPKEDAMCGNAQIAHDGKRCGSFRDAVAEAVRWGADVVFTPSVMQINDTLRAAIEYEDVIFLNCSINLAHHAVRTYYAKLYEAKFLAGIVAGMAAAADGTHRIGYASDYPIYGTIAGINAFAIGAAMADPQVKIYLEWESKQDVNWWWSMVDRGIHVISAVDSKHNKDGSSAYGVCYVEKCAPGEGNDLSGLCRIRNLAVPVWKWGKLYEIIVKTIIEGTYHARLVDKKDQATNYWWGMISGVVDIELAEDLSPYTKQLVGILRRDIINGIMNPFDGELRSQDGLVRRADDEPLSSMDVITMNWLCENIIGEIPPDEALTDQGRATVSVSGVK